MKTQGRAAASTLFVIGLGMLWAAGFAPSLATVVGEGISSLVVPILSGATVAALGVAQCCGAALERGPKLALAAAVALAGCAAVGFWPAASGGLVYARPILNGLLFFCWLVAFLRFRDGIADCAVPLGLLLGSALALVFAGPLSAGAPTRMAFLGASCAVFLVLWFACADEGDGKGASVSNARAAQRRLSVRSVLLRYAVLAAGSVALAFVFGVMTDLHGWMASEQAACTIQVANGIAAAFMAVVFALHRRPFRVDAALTMALPLFALALLSGPAEAGDVSFSRLAIMVGYLLFFHNLVDTRQTRCSAVSHLLDTCARLDGGNAARLLADRALGRRRGNWVGRPNLGSALCHLARVVLGACAYRDRRILAGPQPGR